MIASPQIGLFDLEPLPTRPNHAPFQRTSDTSKDAAERMRPRTGRLHGRILEYAKQREPLGFTRKDVERELKIGTATACPRLLELEQRPRHQPGLYKMTKLVKARDGAMVEKSVKSADGCAIYRYRAGAA